MKTNTQRKSATPPQRKEVQKEKGPAQRRVLIFPIDLTGAGQETSPETSRMDRIESALKSLLSDRHADKNPGYPAPPPADPGYRENRNGCLDAGCSTSAPTPSGVMQTAASLLSRLTTLTGRVSQIRSVLRRVPSEASSEPKCSHEDLVEIQGGQHDFATRLENLVYEIESSLGI